MKKRIFQAFLLWAVIIPALAGASVMLLWNALCPSIFGLGDINFLQGVGLFVLGQLLSCGFGFGLIFLALMSHGHSANQHHRMWHDHWHKMTRQQRQDFFNRRMSMFGGFKDNADDSTDVKPDGKEE
ncbi:MAG: hypothetical protein K2G17_06555 [Duncaniella sp.]|nr:hypothetical protein [Duncaniella sp.]